MNEVGGKERMEMGVFWMRFLEKGRVELWMGIEGRLRLVMGGRVGGVLGGRKGGRMGGIEGVRGD